MVNAAMASSPALEARTTSTRLCHGHIGQECYQPLADIRVDGLWFFVGRRASGDRSITVVRADALGATIPVNAEPAFDANPRAAAALPLRQPNLGEALLGYSSDETCTSATCPDL